jgi:hypothetical protein
VTEQPGISSIGGNGLMNQTGLSSSIRADISAADERKIEDGLATGAIPYVKDVREHMGRRDCLAIAEAKMTNQQSRTAVWKVSRP